MPIDMSEERRPKRKVLLPIGWREFEILDCSEEVKSKQGNPKYVITIRDVESEYEEEIHPITVKGKRWFLKSICEACEVPIDENGHLMIDPPNPLPIKGKKFLGLVEHEPNLWYDRENNPHNDVQHKIVEAKGIAWKD